MYRAIDLRGRQYIFSAARAMSRVLEFFYSPSSGCAQLVPIEQPLNLCAARNPLWSLVPPSGTSLGFSRPAAPRCQRQQGPENVMHASHQGIGRERCGVFYVKMVRRLMAPAGIRAAMRPCATGLRKTTYLRRFSTSTPSRARAATSASEKPRARSTASPCSLKRGGALRVPPGVRDSFIGVPRPR